MSAWTVQRCNELRRAYEHVRRLYLDAPLLSPADAALLTATSTLGIELYLQQGRVAAACAPWFDVRTK
jgi:hypothetical protein